MAVNTISVPKVVLLSLARIYAIDLLRELLLLFTGKRSMRKDQFKVIIGVLPPFLYTYVYSVELNSFSLHDCIILCLLWSDMYFTRFVGYMLCSVSCMAY